MATPQQGQRALARRGWRKCPCRLPYSYPRGGNCFPASVSQGARSRRLMAGQGDALPQARQAAPGCALECRLRPAHVRGPVKTVKRRTAFHRVGGEEVGVPGGRARTKWRLAGQGISDRSLFMITPGCPHKLFKLRRSGECSPGNDDCRKSIDVNKCVISILGHTLHRSPGRRSLTELA